MAVAHPQDETTQPEARAIIDQVEYLKDRLEATSTSSVEQARSAISTTTARQHADSGVREPLVAKYASFIEFSLFLFRDSRTLDATPLEFVEGDATTITAPIMIC
jgi:hypothetical protein